VADFDGMKMRVKLATEVLKDRETFTVTFRRWSHSISESPATMPAATSGVAGVETHELTVQMVTEAADRKTTQGTKGPLSAVPTTATVTTTNRGLARMVQNPPPTSVSSTTSAIVTNNANVDCIQCTLQRRLFDALTFIGCVVQMALKTAEVALLASQRKAAAVNLPLLKAEAEAVKTGRKVSKCGKCGMPKNGHFCTADFDSAQFILTNVEAEVLPAPKAMSNLKNLVGRMPTGTVYKCPPLPPALNALLQNPRYKSELDLVLSECSGFLRMAHRLGWLLTAIKLVKSSPCIAWTDLMDVHTTAIKIGIVANNDVVMTCFKEMLAGNCKDVAIAAPQNALCDQCRAGSAAFLAPPEPPRLPPPSPSLRGIDGLATTEKAAKSEERDDEGWLTPMTTPTSPTSLPMLGQCVWVRYDELNCHWPCIFSGDGTSPSAPLQDVGKEALVISLPLSLNEEDEVMIKDMRYPFLDYLKLFQSKPPLASTHPKYNRLFKIAVETAATRAKEREESTRSEHNIVDEGCRKTAPANVPPESMSSLLSSTRISPSLPGDEATDVGKARCVAITTTARPKSNTGDGVKVEPQRRRLQDLLSSSSDDESDNQNPAGGKFSLAATGTDESSSSDDWSDDSDDDKPVHSVAAARTQSSASIVTTIIARSNQAAKAPSSESKKRKRSKMSGATQSEEDDSDDEAFAHGTVS
jgi:hypothetical protein